MNAIIKKYLSVNVLSVGVALISSVLLARVLGPEKRGEIMAIQVWPNFISYIGTLGLIQAVTYFESSKREKTPTIICNSVTVGIFQAAILIPVGFFILKIVYPKADQEFAKSFLTILAVIPLTIISQYLISVLQANHYARQLNILRLIIPVGYSISLLVLLFIGFTIQRVVLSQIFLNVCVLSLSIGFTYKHCMRSNCNKNDFKIDFKVIKELHQYGIKSWLGDVAQNLNNRADQIFVASILTPVQMGYYAVSLSITNILSSLSNAFKMYIFPEIASKTEQEPEGKNNFLNSFNSFWNLNLILSLALILATIPGVYILYGDEYKDAIIPAVILIIGSVFANSKSVIISALQGLGRPLWGSFVELAGFMMLSFMMILLSQGSDILVVAVAVTAVNIAQFAVILNLVTKRFFKLSPNTLLKLSSNAIKGFAYKR